MNKLKSIKIITVIFLLISVTSCGLDEDAYTIINPVLIGKDIQAGTGDTLQQNIVISNSDDWNKLINRMDSSATGSFTETDVDFSNFMIIAVIDQPKPLGGYTIEIKHILEYSGSVTCKIKYFEPELGITVETQPYHIVKIPKTSKQIIFN